MTERLLACRRGRGGREGLWLKAGLGRAGCLGHALDVPGQEFLDLILVRRERPGLVCGTGDAELLPAHEGGVLAVRCSPYLGEIFEVVVDTLDGILVHQPFGSEQRRLRADRQDIEDDGVIAEKVVPGIGLGVKR